MGSSLLEPMLAVARGESLREHGPITWLARHGVTTVVAAPGYPDKPATGGEITLPPARPDVHLFHAGTKLDGGDRLVAAGGRVLAVTAVADTLDAAREASWRAASAVGLEGKQLRSDIGWRDLRRGAGAP
jgi:phosphoribosylamine--glycine ligase